MHNLDFVQQYLHVHGGHNSSIAVPVRHLTPASWAWVQESTPLESEIQFISRLSLPVHSTLSSHILPVPSPKLPPLSASDPIKYIEELVTYRIAPNFRGLKLP